MFRRIVIPAGAAAALLLGGAGAALASQGGPHTTSGSFSYTDYTFGQVTCHEVHHPSNNLPAGKVPAGSTTTGGYDSISCSFKAKLTPGQSGVIGWNSDFHGDSTQFPQFSQIDQNGGSLSYTVNPHGKGYHGVAWYPNN